MHGKVWMFSNLIDDEDIEFMQHEFISYVIDEMIAILSDREEVIKKKEMEQAQAVINEIYRNGL